MTTNSLPHHQLLHRLSRCLPATALRERRTSCRSYNRRNPRLRGQLCPHGLGFARASFCPSVSICLFALIAPPMGGTAPPISPCPICPGRLPSTRALISWAMGRLGELVLTTTAPPLAQRHGLQGPAPLAAVSQRKPAGTAAAQIYIEQEPTSPLTAAWQAAGGSQGTTTFQPFLCLNLHHLPEGRFMAVQE